MKKIYMSCLAIIAGLVVNGQVAVTFSVDMNAVAPGTDSLHIAGNFNEPDSDWNGANFDPGYNAAYTNWAADGIAMTDPDMDGIYSVELMLNPARYEFKFVNGNTWENVPGACATQVSGNNNRQILVGASATSYPTVCFEQCAACGENAVRLRLDVSTLDLDGDGNFAELGEDISPDGINLLGGFFEEFTPMQDWNNDNLWEGTFQVGNATSIEYKYFNGNDLAVPTEINLAGSCVLGNGNREDAITDANMVTPIYCWELCEPCTQPIAVTFNVDMNASCINTADGVNLMGTVTNWATGQLMTDDNADGIWSLTVYLAPGTFQYKYRVGGNGWEGYSGDRSLTVVAETPQDLPVVCFGLDAPCGTVFPPASITFQARPGDATIPSGHSIWVMGNFTDPQWQTGAIQLTDDDQDGTWTTTVADVCILNVLYKFVIGLPYNANDLSTWVEESASFSTLGGCGVLNTPYSDNRLVVRDSGDPITVCWDINTCTSCLVIGVDESATNSGFEVYPVPADEMLTVSFSKPVSSNMSASLINQLGQVVLLQDMAMNADMKSLIINTSSFSPGVYSLVMRDGESVFTRTISIR